MIIGIKYCGGCNPTFDRKQFIEHIVSEFDKIYFETAKNDVEYDVLIVISGCSRACARHNNLKSKEKIIVNSEHDFAKVINLIKKYMKNETL